MKRNLTTYAWLVIAALIVGGMIWTTRERFVPQFLDRQQEARTQNLEDSSYSQTTNHFSPTPGPNDAIPGIPGKDQVNQWKAHIV